MSHYRPIISPSGDSSNPLGKSQWTGLVFRAGLTTLTHPIEYAKVLIQIGHEPIAPKNTKTFFGKPALALPSVFQYIGHIKKKDGLLGLYNGLAPRLISIGLTALVSDQVSKKLKKRKAATAPKADGAEDEEAEEDDSHLSAEEKLWLTVEKIIHESSERLAILVVTQPFQVLAVRCMAQFVGGENKYNGILSGFGEIYRENGILGFWSGLIPRAIGEVATIVLTAAATYLVNTYVLEEKQLKSFTKHFASFMANSLCYPFQVVGNCMIVSRSGLAAGYPPCMPLHRSWVDCWTHLSKDKQLKRGSQLLFRYYTGHQVIVGDKAIPVNPNMFKRVSN